MVVSLGDSEGSFPSMPAKTVSKQVFMDFKDRLGRFIERMGWTLIVSSMIVSFVVLASVLLGMLMAWLMPSWKEYTGMILSAVLVVALVWYASTGKDE